MQMLVNPLFPKRRMGVIFTFLCFLFAHLSGETLSLDECLLLAKRNNIQLQELRMEIERAKADLKLALSSYYPNLNLTSGYHYTKDQFRETTGGEGSFSTGLAAQYALYQGGGIKAQERIARIRLKIAEENYRQVENDLVYSVKNTFYKILQLQEQVSLIQDVKKRREENLILIRLNYNVGRENEPNVKEAEANLAQSEYEYLKSQKNLSLGKLELSYLLNRPGEDITLRDEGKEKEFPSLDSLKKEAENRRPEIAIAQKTRLMAQEEINQAKSNCFPRITLSSSYAWQGKKVSELKGNWSAGINLSLPLFSGFANQAKISAAKINLKGEELKILALTQKINKEVEEAYTNWQLAQSNLTVSEKILDATRTAYQLTKLQYEQGRTTYFFLQQKEGELTQAENNYLNALYNLRLASANLEKVLGREE